VCIGLSVLGGVLCLVLMIRRPRRRREPAVLAADGRPAAPALHLPWPLDRWWPAAAPAGSTTTTPHGSNGSPAAAPVAGDGDGDGDQSDGGTRIPGRGVAAAAAAALGLVAAVNLPATSGLPLLAVLLAGAVYLAARSRRGASLLGTAAVAALALAATYIVGLQWRYGPEPAFGWPLHFERVHVVALAAAFLLAGEAVRDLLTRRRDRPGSGTPDEPPGTGGATPVGDPGADGGATPVGDPGTGGGPDRATAEERATR
jgi:hypothetical protein